MGNERDAVALSTIAAAVGTEMPVTRQGHDVLVADVHMDSRAVTPHSLYAAIRGSQADGHDYIAEAVANGAAAVAVETPQDVAIPQLVVADTRAALGWIAAAVHHDPAAELALIGITGTNGKTTVAHMLAAMAAGSDRETAVIGTVSANLDDIATSPRTTPEASDMQRILRQLADRGRITDVAIEVSSHAMEMGRVNGTRFDVVAFTNLSQDHLDYHHTMENYYAAKAKLFARRWAPRAVIWTDDSWGQRLAAETEIPVTRVGTTADCDVTVTHGESTPHGTSFSVAIEDRVYQVNTALAGWFNVANTAIALSCAHLQGWDLDHCVMRLGQMPPIPGRYNTIGNERDIWIVVDYAHTPDAIANIIAETRDFVTGKIIAVAGAGGDRDREKRPLMGEALTTADHAIVTTDNPRSEDPDEIIRQVLSGARGQPAVVADRRHAIRTALGAAAPGDAVLILGKGHEREQEFADIVLPFADGEVVREELDRMRAQP